MVHRPRRSRQATTTAAAGHRRGAPVGWVYLDLACGGGKGGARQERLQRGAASPIRGLCSGVEGGAEVALEAREDALGACRPRPAAT